MKWKVFLLIALISSAVYANSLHNSFHFDDQHYIVENTFIRDIRSIPSFFFSPAHSSFEKAFTSHYRPLLVTSYALNYAIGGLRPEGYHIVNLLFHIGSAFLLYLILNAILPAVRQTEVVSGAQTKRSRNNTETSSVHGSGITWRDGRVMVLPLLAAIIFAVHPFNSEVVNYITARSSVMCAFFYLLSFYLWIMFRNTVVSGRFPYYIASVLAFLLAMLTKETAITLPAVLLLYDFYFRKNPAVSRCHNSSSAFIQRPYAGCLPYLPHIILIIVPYLIYRIYVYGYIVGGGTRNYLTNILIQPKVLLNYIQLMSFPSGLSIEHDISLSGTIYDVSVILSGVSILIILFISYYLFRRGGEWRILSFFILWFFITLLPTTVIPLNAVLQENRGYLAGIVFSVFAGICLSRLRKRLILPGFILLITGFSILTISRNIAWKDDLSLWSDAVAKSPLSARAHDNLGLAWMGVGKYDMALEEFDKVIRLNPQYYLAWYNAGVAYQIQGDLEKARQAYEESLKINPAYFRSYYNAGIVYKRLGELDLAVKSYDKAITLDPRHPFVYNNLGVALTEIGDYKRAEDVFKMAVEMNPSYEKAFYNLGNVYFRNKEYVKAAGAYKAAVSLRPDYKEAEEMLKETIAKQQ